MKYRVYMLEKRDLDLGNIQYTDYRYFLNEVDSSPFEFEYQAIDYCLDHADKNNKYTVLPVYGG